MGARKVRASAGERPIFGPQDTVLRLLFSRLLCATAVLSFAAFSSQPAMSQQATPAPSTKQTTPAPSTKQTTPAPSTQQTTPAKTTEIPHAAHAKHHKKPEVAPVAVPTVAPNLLDQPATPATVTANNNELTVKADNSSLSQILHQVSSAMGMKLDGLGGDERVFGSFGPGDPREVLTALLDGTSYNVMMVGDLPNGAPRELLLSRRGAGGATPPPPANANANNQNQPQLGDQDNPDDTASPDDSDDSGPPMQYTPPSITPAEPPPPGSPSEAPPSEAPPRPIPQMQNAPQ
jgi:hypothetical protein